MKDQQQNCQLTKFCELQNEFYDNEFSLHFIAHNKSKTQHSALNQRKDANGFLSNHGLLSLITKNKHKIKAKMANEFSILNMNRKGEDRAGVDRLALRVDAGSEHYIYIFLLT